MFAFVFEFGKIKANSKVCQLTTLTVSLRSIQFACYILDKKTSCRTVFGFILSSPSERPSGNTILLKSGLLHVLFWQPYKSSAARSQRTQFQQFVLSLCIPSQNFIVIIIKPSAETRWTYAKQFLCVAHSNKQKKKKLKTYPFYYIIIFYYFMANPNLKRTQCTLKTTPTMHQLPTFVNSKLL